MLRAALQHVLGCARTAPLQVKSSSPAAQEHTWLNTLIYIFLVAFKKFKRLTPTSSSNLWQLNKGRVLGVR